MKAYTLSHWGLPLTVAMLALGGLLAWASMLTADAGLQALSLTGGIGLVLCGVAIVLATAATRVRKDAADKLLSKYGCPRCDYAPHPDNVENDDSFPCPSCGEPLYPE